MKIRKIRCPHCEDVVELDFDVGLKQQCPECGTEIVISSSKTVVRRRRSGIRVGSSVHGIHVRENDGAAESEGDPEHGHTPRKRRRSKRKKMKVVQSTHVGSSDGRAFALNEVVDVENEEEIDAIRSKKRRIKPLIMTGLALLTVALVLAGTLFLKQTQKANLRGSKDAAILLSHPSKGPAAREGTTYDRPGQLTPTNFQALSSESTTSSLTRGLRGLGLPERASDRSRLARETAIAFLRAPSLKIRSQFIRNYHEIKDTVSRHYETNDPGAIPYRRISETGAEDSRINYIAFAVEFTDGTQRMLGLEYTGDGYRVDWPSFVVYSEMDWRELKIKKPKLDKRMRVHARVSDYFNYGFDEETYACYQLSSPTGYERSIFGYVKRDSQAHLLLKKLDGLARGESLPLVLDIGYPRNPRSDNLVLIKRVVSNGWMIREEPVEEL